MSLNMHYSLHLWRDLPSPPSKHSDQVTVHSCRESEGDGGGDEEDSLCYALSVQLVRRIMKWNLGHL